MEQRCILSVTVQCKSTRQFAGVLSIEDDLENLLSCQDALTFNVDSCSVLLNSIKDLKWTKFRACQHVRLHLLLLRLKSYGRIDLENPTICSNKTIGKLKAMRKLCRFICRQFMVLFDTEEFVVFDKGIRKYEEVISSGFPLTLWYLADEKLADAIASDFKTKKMSRAQQYFYYYCLQIDLEQFINDTNIRKLLENEIKKICRHKNELSLFYLSKVHEFEEQAFKTFVKMEESWCWTTLGDLTFKDDPSESINRISLSKRTVVSQAATLRTTSTSDCDDSASMIADNTNEVQLPESILQEEIDPTSKTAEDKINDAVRKLAEYNRAMLQADLDQVQSFLLSTETIDDENLLAQFFTYKNRKKSTQTQDDDTNTAQSTQSLNKSFGTQTNAESIHEETHIFESPIRSQQLMFPDNSIFASSQLAHILGDQRAVSPERLLNDNRTTPPIATTCAPRIVTSACFTIRNHLTFSQISEIDFNIICPIQSFTVNLKFFGNCDKYCLTENSICQLLNVSAKQWIPLRKVFVEVGNFEYKAKQKLPKYCSPPYKYLYYLFKTIDLVKDCISFVPDMHSNDLRAVRETNFVHVQRQAICLHGIIDNDVLRQMRKDH